MEQILELLDVFKVLVEVIGLWGFQSHRVVLELSTLHQESEGFKSNCPHADVLMPVPTASQGFLRIVEMEHFEVLQARRFVEFLKNLPAFGVGFEIVPGGEGVAGVETVADSFGFLH